MARTAIAVQDMSSLPPVLASVNLVAADNVNNNMFPNDGRTLLIVQNTTAGALNVTIVSVADREGRTGDQTLSVPANTGIAIGGPFRKSAWDQTGTDIGNVYVNPASASLKVGAVRLTTF